MERKRCWAFAKVSDEYKADVRRKLQNAYAMTGYAEAKRALDQLHRELMDLNPSAARSLEEGMEETLTVHKLRANLVSKKPIAKQVAGQVCRHGPNPSLLRYSSIRG